MYRTISKIIIIRITSIALLWLQVNPGFSGLLDDENVIRVAFVGIEFDNIDPDIQERLIDSVSRLFERKPKLTFIPPHEVEAKLGENQISSFYNNRTNDAYATVAEILRARYVFSGSITNESRDPERTLLAGSIHRYDYLSSNLIRMDILRYLRDLDLELQRIDENMIEPMIPRERSLRDSWPVLVVFGVLLAGFVTLFLTSGTAGTEGTPPGPGDPL